MYRGSPFGYLLLLGTAIGDARGGAVGDDQLAAAGIVIDARQRLTTLRVVMNGAKVTFRDGRRGRVTVAFRPRDGRFAAVDDVIARDPDYLPDISQLWATDDGAAVDMFIERLRAASLQHLDSISEDGLRAALGRLTDLQSAVVRTVEIKNDLDTIRLRKWSQA